MHFTLIALLFSMNVLADGEWWHTPRSEDEKYLYYVGVSEGKSDLSQLQDKAFNKAMGEVIREHFGMNVQINESAVEELQNESFQVVTKQSSAPLFIKGIGLMRTYEKELDDGNRIYVQIRVDKASLKDAIQNQITKPGEDSLNTYGESHDSKVDIQVKSHPQGALIHFGHLGRRFSLQGQGDARFYLPRGKYQMVVSSPGYATVTKEINLLAQGHEENIILEELTGLVDLEVYPDDARIEYEGKKIVAGNRKIQVGKTHKFTVSHPDYFSKEIELILHNPETVSEVVKLEPRPSTLTYNVYPSHAKIFVDGREMAPYKGKFDVEPGKKTITISANGYFTHEEEVYAGTNREYPLKVIHLKYDDQNIPVSDKGFAVRWELNPFGLYGKVGYGLLLPIALHFEYKYFSLGVGYNGSTYEKKNTKTYDNYDVSIEDLYATARIMTPTLNDMKFFISGTYGQYHHQAKDELAENEFRYTKSYQGVGGGIRYYITPKWSLHTEYFKINTIHLQTNIKKKEDRIIMGLAYEF